MYRKPLFILVLLSMLLSLSPVFAAPTAIDLDIRTIEVSQGIQNMANSMPLITRRRTIVRVYPINLPGSNVAGVRARLKVYSINGSQATLLGTLLAKNNPITVQGNGGARTNLNHSFWFEIPKAWMVGKVRFTAELNYDNAISDPNAANNTQSVTLQTRVADALNVRMVPLHLVQNGNNVSYYCNSACQTIASGVLRYHPTETLNVAKFNSALYPVGHAIGKEWNINSDKDRGRILDRLSWSRAWHIDYNRNYYGMVNGSFGMFGLGRLNGHVALGTMNNSTGPVSTWHLYGSQIMAHELGHNQGLNHVNCAGNESSGGAVDPSYPWSFPTCQLAAIDVNGYYGLDTYYAAFGQSSPMPISNNPAQAAPQRAFPFMGYKDPAWPSPWEFCKLLPDYGISCGLTFSKNQATAQAESTASVAPAADPSKLVREQMALSQIQDIQQFAQISGIVDDATSEVELNPIYVRTVITPAMRQEWAERRSNGQTITDYRPQATWEIAMVDAAGAVLHRQNILFDVHDHQGTTVAILSDLVPLPTGSQTLQILRNGTPVVQRSLSANAPVANITSSGGALAAGTVLTWNASDADGDTLNHTLLYSNDNWATWEVLALDVETTSITLTAEMVADLAAGPRGQIKLITSDGFRTSESIAPVTFEVANHAPEVFIESPTSGSWLGLEDQLLLEGKASDVDEPELNEKGFVWTSNIDGELGVGASLIVERLSPGQHIITLTVTDSADSSSSAQIIVDIGAPQRQPIRTGR